MGNRLTKIYTRTGDDGTTGMANGDRVSKSDLLFQVMGDVDELNAQVGMIAAQIRTLVQSNQSQMNQDHQSNREIDNKLMTQTLHKLAIVQHLLFNIGGELAMPEFKGIHKAHIEWLEADIDHLNESLHALKDFILPTGSVLVSQVHISRTVCRRAERLAVTLKSQRENAISDYSLTLLNRLSDWLFVLSRYCAKAEGSQEVLWDKSILESLS